MHDRLDVLTTLLWAVLAGLGGMARLIGEVMGLAPPDVFTKRIILIFLLRFFAYVFVAVFCGLTAVFTVSEYVHSITLRLAIASVFGYLGVDGMKFVTGFLTKRLPTKL